MDWSIGAFNLTADGESIRIQGANNALMVARVTACFVERIMSTYGITETSVNMLGHSMGAQVMGLAAAWLSERFGIRIGSAACEPRNSQSYYYHVSTLLEMALRWRI